MKKKTLIIISTIVFTLILVGLLAWRIYLITLDTTGIYTLPTENIFSFVMNYMPELTLVFAILAIHLRKRWGLAFSVIAMISSILSLFIELVILIIRSIDIMHQSIPSACIPLLDIPVIVICIVLFLIKFKIYTLPKTISFK